jgi:peroxiredoxin
MEMSRRSVWILGLVLMFGIVVTKPDLRAQDASLPDVRTLGPQVGARVPDFVLRDQEQRERSLQSLMGARGLMLVFSRSADWCPYCKTQFAELESRRSQLEKSGYRIAAITYDPVPILADFAKRRGIRFPLLSDPGSATIKRFGILNTTIPVSNTQAYGVPFPGTFVLNRDAVVTARFFEPAYQERNTVASIMARLGGDLDAPATRVSSPQMEITAYISDTTVAPGTHFSVVVDVKPAPGIHVYAPGVSGYKAIGVTVQQANGLIVRDAHYPPSEIYEFKPLNERVPVFQRPFRLVQDLTVDASPQGLAALKNRSSLTINAVLTYQACDDRICYTPQTVPLSWVIALRSLDRERTRDDSRPGVSP